MTITDPTAIPTDRHDHMTFVAEYARLAMDEHGLAGVPFAWDNGKRRWGACHWKRSGYGGTPTVSKITLSRHLCAINSLTDCEDVILHEIAHALAGYDAGHGYAWKRVAREIGADPSRCYETDKVNTPAAPWVGTCPNGHTSDRHRLTEKAKRSSCGKCCSRYNPDYHYVWKRNPEYRG